ncbi:MAG: cytochrome P460 family protein [Gammaproteobacteria bacterium]|nr:cytochrome P460 family protein [Gammaproteobacteria bacterium]
MRRLGIAIMTVFMASFGVGATGDEAAVDYPSGYRAWQHVKTMLIQPGHPLENPFGGIHHIYANAQAMSGLENGRYGKGAVFVFDLLDYDDRDQTLVEGNRKRIDVMQYDAERFSETGGWGYDTFVGDSSTERLDQDVVAACHACHLGASASNYVYSQFRK